MRQNLALCGNGLTIIKRQTLDCLKLKEFAENNFTCGKIGERVESIEKKSFEGKQEILR